MTTLSATILDPGFPGSKISGLDFDRALIDGEARFESLMNSLGEATITSASTSRVDFTIGGNSGFMTGSFFPPSVLVVNSFFLNLGSGQSVSFSGAVDLINGSETLTSMSVNTAAVRFGFHGNVTVNPFTGAVSGSMSELHFGVGGVNAALEGNLGFAFDGSLDGTVDRLTLDDKSFANPGAPHDVIQIDLASVDAATLQAQLLGVSDAQSLLAVFDYSGPDHLVLDFKSGVTFDSGPGNDFLQGGRGTDSLTGGSGDDSLFGAANLDFLVGGAGNDLLDGGSGNDTADYSSALTGIVANLATGTASDGLGGSDTLVGIEGLRGSFFADVLTGGAGNDRFEAMGGADTMTGGAGNDFYLVTDVMQRTIELPGGGTDTTAATVNWTLQANVENLVLAGLGLSGTGNDLANVITAFDGNDTLDGRGGADTLIGGAGDDIYILGPGDVVIDSGGTDTALSSSSLSPLQPGVDNLNLAMIAGKAIVTGTAGANHLIGNYAANLLDGGAGNDTLEGGKGDDFLLGGMGNDSLDGGRGADVMDGGAGNDTYRVDSAQDRIVELAGGGVDTVQVQAARYALDPNVENAVIVRATGSIVSGNALANRIEGGAGADTLTGGGGADQFVFRNPGAVDHVTDFTHGVDKVALDHTVFADGAAAVSYDAETGALSYHDTTFAILGPAFDHPAFSAADLQIV
jgi:Ca2+-binding RTX toxin-like protein